ncbi:MAG TPA: hypothetical protein EYP87_00680, partial [Flavobacteriaceae bacterium]|nr:hypothetical protein [Flavobacteriaceae bacterium]
AGAGVVAGQAKSSDCEDKTYGFMAKVGYDFGTHESMVLNFVVEPVNGSSLALPRIMAGLLENHQTPNGIKIPKCLVDFCGFDMID